MSNRQRFVFWRLDVVNRQKTRLLGLGIWKERKQWPSKLLTFSPNIKVLGIVYCPTVKETKAINLSQLQTKVRRSLWAASNRRLTVLQSAQFFNKFIVHKETNKKEVKK